MRSFLQRLSNYSIFVLVLLIVCALQSSLWLNFFGWFPAPQLWLTVLVFWVLYRELWESVLMVYILSIISSGFTALPFAHLLSINLLTAMGLFFVKKRLYWAGPIFYMLASGISVVFFSFFSYLVSWKYDLTSNRDFPVLGLLITLLFTMIVSFPFHGFFSWLDKLTHKEHPTEAGTGVL